VSKEKQYGTASDEQDKAEAQERIPGSDENKQRQEADKPQASGWPVGERAKNHEVRQIWRGKPRPTIVCKAHPTKLNDEKTPCNAGG
jgi:hypothetical protein